MSLFKTNGMWTWFNGDEVAYMTDQLGNGNYLMGVVTSSGHIELSRYFASGGIMQTFRILSSFSIDDHVNPSIAVLDANGTNPNRVNVCLSKHPGDSYAFNSKAAYGFSGFTKQGASIDADRAYARVVQTGDANHTLWWFLREDTNPGPHGYGTSTDGTTWNARVTFFQDSAGTERPYSEYFVEGNRIDIIITNGHPDEIVCHVYHMYITVASDGLSFTISKPDGTQVGNYNLDGTTISGQALPLNETHITKIYDGTSTNSWVWDLRKCNGTLTAAISTFGSASLTTPGNHNYKIATYNGSSWSAFSQVCDGGGTGNDYLYAAQVHYSGGIALNPDNGNKVLVSRKYGAGDFRVEEWTNSGGWSKTTDVSGNTSSVNARPMTARNSPTAQFFYWRGTYTSFISFSTDIYSYPDLTVNASYTAALKPVSPAWQASKAPPGVKGYWPFTDGSGTTVTDYFTSPNNLAFVSTPAWASDSYGPNLGGFSTTKYAKNDSVSSLFYNGSYPCGLSCTFKNTATADAVMVSLGSSSSANPVASLRINDTTVGHVGCLLRDDAATGLINIHVAATPNDGNWHHLSLISYAANDHRIFFDGVQVGASTTTLGTMTCNQFSVGVLRRNTITLPCNGSIGSVMIFSGDAPDAGFEAWDRLTGTYSAVRAATTGVTLPQLERGIRGLNRGLLRGFVK